MYELEDDLENEEELFSRVDMSQREKEVIAEFSCHRAYRFGDEIGLKVAEEIVRRLA